MGSLTHPAKRGGPMSTLNEAHEGEAFAETRASFVWWGVGYVVAYVVFKFSESRGIIITINTINLS